MPTYRVIGGRAVLGNKPGTEFTAELTEDHERRLMALEHIELVETATNVETKPFEDSSDYEAPLDDEE